MSCLLDTNVLVRYLVADDARQTEAARALLAGLTAERPGFVCREVALELSWVLERAYGFSRDRIAAAARRFGADTLYTFDRKAARLPGAELLAEAGAPTQARAPRAPVTFSAR